MATVRHAHRLIVARRRGLGRHGLLLALLALVGQLALGGMVVPQGRPADPVAALARLTLLCQPGEAPRRAPPVPVPTLHAVLTLPAMMPAPPVVAPLPRRHVVRVAMLAAAPAAAVARVTLAAYPRGPPPG